MIRKILLTAGAAALMSTPAWALPGNDQGHGHGPMGPPSTTPNNQDNPGNQGDHHKGDNQGDNHKGNNQGDNHKGNSHKCVPHMVGYVASGTLVKQTLTANANGTFSGEVEVEVTHTNRHAAGDRGKTVKYTVAEVRVVFGVMDINKDGTVGLDDLAAGDRVHLIGKITALAKKCDQTQFTATTTIRKIVFRGPRGTAGGKD